MPISIEVPDAYPLVMLSSSVLPFVANIMMGGPVMKARKQYEVKYPNLYAVPGVHKDADAFNRVQRGHQNMLVSEPSHVLILLLRFALAALLTHSHLVSCRSRFRKRCRIFV